MKKEELPTFPFFKTVTFADKEIFDSFARQCGTYSDFNFNSFYAWDTSGTHAYSIHNDNLILRFADYQTGEPFYTLIGKNKIGETVTNLIEYAKSQNIDSTLKLVPEITIKHLEGDDFDIEEDEANFDYIFSINVLSTLNGRQCKNKRQAAKKCVLNNEIEFYDHSNDVQACDQISDFIEEWKEIKLAQGKEADIDNEYVSIKRMLDFLTQQENLKLTFAKQENKLIGFSIDELLPDKCVLSHYFKTLPNIYGLSECLNKHVAQKLFEAGYEHWNWEQDLGLESLKSMKLSYRPESQQKKFIVREK